MLGVMKGSYQNAKELISIQSVIILSEYKHKEYLRIKF